MIFAFVFFASCITPRHTIEINEYILMPNGKQVLGHEKGLTAYIFENNQRKIPFQEFIGDKYKLGSYSEIEYNIDLEGTRFKVYIYENAELEKYFDVSQFMVSNVEPESTIVGSKARFIAISVLDDHNNDAVSETSLYHNIVINYLRNLVKEYNNS
ncbi:MAG: hypothetical protein ACO1N9_14635 [Flavobacterium sp.]